MSRYPGARWRPVARYQPGGSSCQAMSRYDGGIDHTYVGSPSSDAAFSHFNTPGTPLPHFMVFRDGSIDQYVDTRYRSSACLDGNPRLITWETADGYPGLWTNGQAPKDTPAMVKAKADLMVWLHKEHGVPLVRMPSSRPTARGFGWHRLGIDGNYEQPAGQLLGGRVSGGERWSLSAGKTCPTSVRIHQFVEETIPLAAKLAVPKPSGPVRVPRRLVFHIHKGQFYFLEDSWRGALTAIAKHFGWIDYDCQITKDGVLVIAHGPRPLANNTRGGLHDPLGKIHPSATYDELTWAEVSRLRSKRGNYRVRRADDLVPKAVKRGLKVELELKSTKISRDDLRNLRKHLSDPSRVQVKALPPFYTALRGAHDSGFKTILLGRDAEIPKSAQPYITYHRGPVRWH